MTRRITASHPDFPEIDRHNRMLCLLVNAHCHPHTAGVLDDMMPIPERLALYSDITDGLDELLDGGAFRDFAELDEMW
jgi:hypothetical protein